MSSVRWDKDQNFNGTNYSSWKYRIKLFLESQGLWRYVCDPFPVNAPRSDQERFRQKDLKALNQITSTLSNNILTYISDKVTSASVLTALDSQYENKSWGSEMMARSDFVNLKYNEQTPMLEHINEVKQKTNALQNLSTKIIDDNERVSQLLHSLPSSYDQIKAVYQAQSSPSSWEDVSSSLLTEWRRRNGNSAPLVSNEFAGYVGNS